MAILMISYSISRWSIEALPADERRVLVAGMNSAQLIRVGLVILGLGDWICFQPGSTASLDGAGTDGTLLGNIGTASARSQDLANAIEMPACDATSTPEPSSLRLGGRRRTRGRRLL
jgi:hypothetical protein